MANLGSTITEPMLHQASSDRSFRSAKVCAVSFLVGMGLAGVLTHMTGEQQLIADESTINMAMQPSRTMQMQKSPLAAAPNMRQIEQFEKVMKQPATLRLIQQEYQQMRKGAIASAAASKDRLEDNFYEKLPAKAAEKPEEERDVIEKAIDASKIIFLPGNVGKAVLDRISFALGVSESTGSAAFVGLNCVFFVAVLTWMAVRINPGFQWSEFIS